MRNRAKLLNSNEEWNSNKRYKVNAVVRLFGSDYQNTTGFNTNPALLEDWVMVKDGSPVSSIPISIREQYNGSSVTVPNGFTVTRIVSLNDINTDFTGIVTGTNLVITDGVENDIYLIDGY